MFSVATDVSDPSRQASATVNVKILDVNDNSPHFVESPTTVAVSRNAPVDTVLGHFKAIDGDEGSLGKVSYRIQTNFDDVFGISKEGDLFLRKPLLNVTEDHVNITIAALDGGRPALRATHTVRVEVFPDQSDKPSFKTAEYTHRALADEQTAGTTVTQVVAGSGNYNYSLRDSASNLFDIDDRGIISFRRKPLESERNRYHILNVTAQDTAGNIASTTVNVFVEGNPIVVTATTPTTASTESAICHFSPNIINAEIRENLPGRQRLVKVTSTCERERRSVMYTIASGSEEFEIDARTGELFVTGPLDREKKGLHFIVVNVVEVDNSTALVEGDTNAKSKLNETEALVTVKVLDENDSPPSFSRLNPEGVYVFAVDWQKAVLASIARVQAFDPDERPHLTYTMSKSDLFAMNATSGTITMLKSLQSINEERFDLEATVSDGKHNVTAPVQIYRLAPGINIVVVAVDSGVDDIDNLLVERQISTAIGLDFNILAKQVYIGEDEHADPAKTHLFAYALEKKTRRPVDAETLKK
ncbi:CBN-CDH-12 protein [Aphelenchoides avenae]|nr:CBN-CDH-12 protein [Aphelenchus avenae]